MTQGRVEQTARRWEFIDSGQSGPKTALSVLTTKIDIDSDDSLRPNVPRFQGIVRHPIPNSRFNSAVCA
jgi:hypothetical protein